MNRVDHQRAESPVPSCVSMKSDWSKDGYIDFKDGHQSADQRVDHQRAESPVPSCVSVKSDWSKDGYIDFKDGHQSADQRVDHQRAESPVPSCVSMKSDWSKDGYIDFKDGHHSTDQRVDHQRAESPVPSCVSMKSDWSKDGYIDFKDGHHSTDQRVDHQRAESPVPSCVSMKSDWSKDGYIDFKDGHQSADQRVDHQRAESPVPSCVSVKSDWSKDGYIDFKDGHHSTDQSNQQQGSSGQSAQEHQTDLDSIFKLLEQKLVTLVKKEMKRFRKFLTTDYPECLESQGEEGEEERRSFTEGALKITLTLLRSLKMDEMADLLMMKTLAPVSRRHLKSYLKKKCQNVSEWIAEDGTRTLLKQIFTELYITEGGSEDVNKEHEVRLIEAASRKPANEMPVSCEDMYEPLPGHDGPIKTVMTNGVAGIGKTVLAQKYALDWAEGRANQKVHFLFPLTFRELNLMKEEKYSLVELLQHFFGGIKKPLICSLKEFQVMFILDGLDELRFPLDFQNAEIVTDVTTPTSVDVLLTNLIRGDLLPSARIWITTRPAAANQIPSAYVDRVTEVRGFTDPQKDEYFVKRFGDEEKARPIVSHVKRSKSLHIMCHIPIFCWMTATVLEVLLKTGVKGSLPKYLTEMYLHFLLLLFGQKSVKYHDGAQTHSDKTPENTKVILVLGKLAFEQLEKGQLIFYEADLRECGIDVREASVYSGMFTQIFKRERGLHVDTVFCFVHLSVQEFLAALHVFVSFVQDGVNLLSGPQTTSIWSKVFTPKAKIHHLYQSAVDKALRSPNGHLDLFLRFLLGLSLDTNQKLLQRLLMQTGNTFQTNHKTIKYIKEKITENPSPERSINLFHCLNELNDHSLEEDIQRYLTSGCLSTDQLSPAQWSALVFILLSSGKLDVFDLKKYSASEEALLRLLPMIKASNKALLSGCNLSERCCQELSSALSSSSSLKEVDLSNNDLQDSGVNLLAVGLGSPHCMLETLKLSGCNLSERCCHELLSALSSSSSLREVDLSNNDLDVFDLKKYSASEEALLRLLPMIKASNKALLSGCNLSDRCCQELSSALSSSSSLREVDLSNNDLQDSGVNLLAVGLGSPHCMLETLKLSGCNLSERCCQELLSALSSSSSLREVDLSNNDLQDSGVNLLAVGLGSPHCMLETLKLSGCNLSERCCQELSSALSSSSSLREVDLSNNDLQDSGVNLLAVGLGSPHCMLETLKLSGCNLSEICCQELSPALSSSSSLREVDLSNNDLQDSGVNLLAVGLGSPHCMLETLNLSGCLVTEKGCSSLTSALRSNPSHLRELNLTFNHPGESGKAMLSAAVKDPRYRLDTLSVDHGGENRLTPGVQKYVCELTLDPNTAHKRLSLSENNRKVSWVREDQNYPPHPHRFKTCEQVMSRETLSGRCYYEVKCSGGVHVAVAHRAYHGQGCDIRFGFNDKSWSLDCNGVNNYTVWHNKKHTGLHVSPSSSSNRVAVHVDHAAGTVSFYTVSSDTLTHLHTFQSTFTGPLYAGFWVGGSVSL